MIESNNNNNGQVVGNVFVNYFFSEDNNAWVATYPNVDKESTTQRSLHKSFPISVLGEDGQDVLHLAVRSRSCDAPFGLPFNYTQYGMYLKAMAKLVGMEAGTLCINMDDVHIYQNQLAWVEELLTREIFLTSPKMEITKELKSLDDLVTLKWENIVITRHSVNRDPFELDKPEMAI